MKNILIVGAGPVGLTLAIELHRRGIAFQIIDKAPGPAPMHESRALAVNARSQSILRGSDVTKRIISKGHQIERVNFYWKGNLRNSVSLNSDNAVTGKLIICPQGIVERILIEQLQVKHITIQWNTTLIDFSEENTCIAANVVDSEGVHRTEYARYIVGCDGAHSQVRKKGGYSFDGESDPQVWSLADVTVKDDRFKHTMHADLRSGQAFATMPMLDNQVRLIHNGRDLLAKHPFKDLGTSVLWESEFKVSYRLVKQYNRGRTFLCGDAAHIHSPVGGRGMNLGIEDAATLAYLLKCDRENEYSALRRPVATKVLKLTHNQTQQMNSSAWFSNVMKKYGPALLNLPIAKRGLLRSIYGLDTPQPEWLDFNN